MSNDGSAQARRGQVQVQGHGGDRMSSSQEVAFVSIMRTLHDGLMVASRNASELSGVEADFQPWMAHRWGESSVCRCVGASLCISHCAILTIVN